MIDKKSLRLLSIAIITVLVVGAISAYSFLASMYTKKPSQEPIRVACVGDSLTEDGYPYYLWGMLGRSGPFTIGNYTQNSDQYSTLRGGVRYAVGNFGVGGTMATLESETPYMNTSVFQSAIEYQPNLVVIMLGTNDAQPGVHQYNASFINDYKTLISAFQELSSKPKIWIVLPPPIFSSQGGKTSPEYFEQNVIPHIEQVAAETNLPTIDIHSALEGYPYDFPDGLHPNAAGMQIIASTVYKAIT